MLDHVGFGVSDFERSKAFYERALAPLGLSLLIEPIAEAAGFGEAGKPFFWIETRRPASRGSTHYVLDPDGNTIEAVCHRPA